MSVEDLEATRDTLMESLERYRALDQLGANDKNYKHERVRNRDVQKYEIEVTLQLAECLRLLAAAKTNPLHRQAALREIVDDLQAALAKTTGPGGSPLLEARVDTQIGQTYKSGKNYAAAEHYYNQAMRIFERQQSGRDVSELKVIIETAEHEQDAVGSIMKKMRVLATKGNKEEEQLRAVFEKFDTEGKGQITTGQLRALATELGTYPPLSEEELEEALMQIDQSDDDELSFEELWMWWVSDKLDDDH